MNSWLSVLSISAMLVGCATVYDGKYDYDEGWRLATVVELGNDSTRFNDASLDCRTLKFETRSRAEQYAYVRYMRSFAPRMAIVPVPDHTKVGVKQRIFINLNDCRVGTRSNQPQMDR